MQSSDIEVSLRDFLRLENISATDGVLTQRVLYAYAIGLDFADALHAAQCLNSQRFVTFDKLLARGAGKAGLRGSLC